MPQWQSLQSLHTRVLIFQFYYIDFRRTFLSGIKVLTLTRESNASDLMLSCGNFLQWTFCPGNKLFHLLLLSNISLCAKSLESMILIVKFSAMWNSKFEISILFAVKYAWTFSMGNICELIENAIWQCNYSWKCKLKGSSIMSKNFFH